MSDDKPFDSGNIMSEIDAIVQNSGKVKKTPAKSIHRVKIEIDKANSSSEAMCGTVKFYDNVKYMDGTNDDITTREHEFHVSDGSMVFEKYDLNKPINKKVMKQIDDTIKGIMAVSYTHLTLPTILRV